MVGDDHGRRAAAGDERGELACDPLARDRGIGNRQEALLGDVVHHVQDAQATAAGELVVHEVDRPSRVGQGWQEQRRPGASGALTASSAPHRQSFLTIEPLRPTLLQVDLQQTAYTASTWVLPVLIRHYVP